MDTKTQKRLSFLINAAFYIVILGLAYLFFAYAFWPAAPFLITFLLAMFLQKPLDWIQKHSKIKRGIASIFLVVFSLAIVVVPLGFLIARLVGEISGFFRYLGTQFQDIPQFLDTIQNGLLDLLKFLPKGLYDSAQNAIVPFFDSLENGIDFKELGISFSTLMVPINGVLNAAKGLPGLFLGSLIGLITLFYLTADYRKFTGFLNRQLPKNQKHLLSDIRQVFSTTIFKFIRAYGLIMLITFGELYLGFLILSWIGVLKTSYMLVIAIAIAIFDILPALGSGGVLIPWAIYALITSQYGLAIGLIVLYITITLVRQVIEPKIVGDQIGMHPVITLACLYFGLKLFGFIGMFLLPITVIILKSLHDSNKIHLWKRRGETESPEPAPQQDENKAVNR